MKNLFTILFLVFCLLVDCAASAQQTPADTTENKLRFFDKIGHWLVAYNMTGPEFLGAERTAFKASAFAEVYVEATIEHQAWMFAMLNRVTLARLLPEERQNPHVLITVKFNPNEDVSQYSLDFSITASGQVNENLSQVTKQVKEKYLDGKTFTDPATALEILEPALREALQGAAEKIGDKLAPNVLVRYNGELFWSGHTIDVLAVEGNYVELEAVDKDGEPLNAASLAWTNADPFDGHKGIVHMTGVPAKLVTLRFGSESLNVTLKGVDIGQDLNDLLKQLIVEALSTKKQEALDTLVVLRRDSVANATQIRDYIAHLESGNFPMEGTDRQVPMFANPILRADSLDLLNEQVNRDIARSLKELKRKARLRHTLRRKLNVVAFADLVVERPERMKDLLDELLRNSGRLVARLVLNSDSKGQRDEARDIVLEFLNQHLEKIVGRYYPPGLSLEPPLAIPQPVANTAFDPAKFLYVNQLVNFEGREELMTRLNAYLPTQSPPLYVFINYTHDLSVAGYQSRATGTRPVGLPPGARYKVFTVVHMPGSVQAMVLSDGGESEASNEGKVIEENIPNEGYTAFEQKLLDELDDDSWAGFECISGAYRRYQQVLDRYDSEEIAFYAGFVKFWLCATEKENCGDEDQFECGVANALLQELDWVTLADALTEFEISKEDVRKVLICLVEEVPIGSHPSNPTFTDYAFRCITGVTYTGLKESITEFITENWQDAYFQGQATIFALTLVSPFKAGIVKKIGKLDNFTTHLSQFKILSKAANHDELVVLSTSLGKGADALITSLKGSIRSTFEDLTRAGLRPEINANSILLKNASDETAAIIYNGKLTPTKWAWSYKTPKAIKTQTSEGYILLKEGDEIKFDLGFKEGRKLEAKEVNDYLVHGQGKDLDGQPYWAGTQVEEIILGGKGEIIYFVENFNDAIPNPGQYASKDPITTIKELREKLAVKEAWKQTAKEPTLRAYRVKSDLKTRSGVIGRQSDNDVELPGGGHQYEIIDYLGGNWKTYLEEIGPAKGVKLK